MKSWKDNFTYEQLEIRRIRSRKWNKNNKERVKANSNQYKLKYPHRLKLSAQKHASKRRAKDPGYITRIVMRYYKDRPWLRHLDYAKSRCNPKTKNFGYRKYYVNAGVIVKLSPDEVKALWFRDNASSLVNPSLDRIYTAGNYSIGNCRFIEQSVNSSRRLNPDSELVATERRKQRYRDTLCAPADALRQPFRASRAVH